MEEEAREKAWRGVALRLWEGSDCAREDVIRSALGFTLPSQPGLNSRTIGLPSTSTRNLQAVSATLLSPPHVPADCHLPG